MNSNSIKKYKSVISSVQIDDREGDRKEYGLKKYKILNPSISHLEYGDYLFTGLNGKKVCVEYKTGSDFINSVTQNNHLHNQVYEMIKHYDYCFIMVETEDIRDDINQLYFTTGLEVSLKQLNGAVASFNTVGTVLYAHTRYQAFDLMMRQAGKCILMQPFGYKFGKKTPNTALNYLSSIHGVNDIASNIVNTLDLHTLQDLMNLTKKDLLTVKLVGEKTADKILRELGIFEE